MGEKITIVIPLDPAKTLDPVRDLNVDPDEADVLVIPGENPSRNRNAGVARAATPFVAFVNAHSRLPDHWARIVRDFFRDHPDVDIVGGPQLTAPDEPPFARATGYAAASVFGAAAVRARYAAAELDLDADETSLTSANLACRRAVFDRVRFDETLYPGEDPRFIADAKQAGFRAACYPAMANFNRRRATPGALARQMFHYGRVRPRKESFGETLKRPYFFAPSLFLLYLLGLGPLAAWSPLFLAPLALYALLDTLAAVGVGLRHRSAADIPRLAFIFPLIHLSYGAGFLLGLLTRPARRA